jgi:hypothetical protein
VNTSLPPPPQADIILILESGTVSHNEATQVEGRGNRSYLKKKRKK